MGILLSVNQMWAVDPTVTLTTSSETSTSSVVVSPITFSFTNGSTNTTWYADGLRFYEGATITISSESDITKIVFTHGISNSGCLNLTSGGGSYNATTKTWTGSSKSITFTVGHSSGTKNGQVKLTQAVVSYASAEPACTDPATALSITSASTATVGTPLSLTTSGGNGGTVTWSVTNGTGTATVDGSTLTPKTAGTVTVKAHQDLNGTTCAQDAELEVSISKQVASFTFSDGYIESTTYYVGDSYTLPSTTTAECADKIFVGWSTVEISTPGDKPTSNYYNKGSNITLNADNVFYAVFAEGDAGGEEVSYTISFANNASSATTINTSTQASTIIAETSRTYVTTSPVSEATFCYYGDNKTSIRVGKSGNAGSITLNLSANGQCAATSIKVNTKLYSSTKAATLSVNGTESQDVPAENGDLTFALDGSNITTISLETSQYVYINSITVTSGGTTYSNYSTVCGPSYTITATRNNTELGSVSLTGKVITATPNECVGYAAPAYSVTSGSATVVQEGNNFRVTPASDCTIQINFVATAEDTYLDEVQDWEASAKYCGSYAAPSIPDKPTNKGTGVCETDHYHFVGWTTNEYRNSPAGHITAAGTDMTGNGTTYYAVWAKEAE